MLTYMHILPIVPYPNVQIRGIRTGMAGTALARPIFKRVQSIILALYVQTMIIFQHRVIPMEQLWNGIIYGG